MEPILLYGFPEGSSMGLIAILEWLGQPYRLCRVDMLQDMKDASYARINARHETPVLVTDQGSVLTETMAIAHWIEARDAERRVSFDPRSPEADRMHQLMGFTNTGFTAAFTPLWAAWELSPPDPGVQATLRSFGRQQVLRRHDQLEAMLGDGPWLVGDNPTLADGLLVGVARWLDFHQVADPARWPRLAAWRKRAEGDRAVRLAVEIENGSRFTQSSSLRGHVDLADLIRRLG